MVVNRYVQTRLAATLAPVALAIVWQVMASGVMVSALMRYIDMVMMYNLYS